RAPGPRIRVVVIDDHQLFSQGIEMLLSVEPDVEIVGITTTAEEGLQVCAELRPGVVLMDVDLPGMNGLEATRRLRNMDPSPQVVVVSADQHPDSVVAALEAGAIGYLP